MALDQLFPPLGLTLTLGSLSLRLLREADLDAYVELITADVFVDPDADHAFAWWREVRDVGPLSSLQHQWRARASVSPQAWELVLGVFDSGRLVGMQDLRAVDFGTRHTVDSGSFVRLDQAGRGVGTLMRQAVVAFAFDHLGAVRAETSAIEGNAASLRVSEKVGYRPNGTRLLAEGGRALLAHDMVVTPESFVRADEPLRVDGVTPALLALLGAGGSDAGQEGDQEA